MKPLFHPQLVNDPFGDPALYVEFLFERRALLFDLGDIYRLAPRKVLRLSDIFVSHTHMDHFIGFDHLLRICLGRDMTVHMFGPGRFIEQVEHKIGGYTWNLLGNYSNDFTIVASELHENGNLVTACFRCRSGFSRESLPIAQCRDGILLDEAQFRVRAVPLDHRVPSLAFSLEEKLHVNVWKNRLDAMHLPCGPWINELKAAILREAPDDMSFRVWWKDKGGVHEQHYPLGELRDAILSIVPGQKIAYIVDAVYNDENAQRIVALARDADLLFIETCFLDSEAKRAAQKYHLTARQAGELARRAGVKRAIPFHFSARHTNRGQELQMEMLTEFRAAARTGTSRTTL